MDKTLRGSLRFCSQFLKLFGIVSFLGVEVLRANPAGEQVVAGAAGFERVGNALTITQGTDRAIINWNSFSIGSGEITRFIQPSSSSAVLNRVITANNPSQIYGTLQANGQVYLINPAGVFVGPGGLVDTAAFVASTRDIANEEFMRGGNLNFTGNSEAGILNQGRIEARQGDVFLIARQVSNEGQIMASDGTVGMISGTEVALHALGPRNYKVRLLDVAEGSGARRAADGVAEVVNQGVIEAANAELAATGNYLSLAIRNDGTVRATGVVANGDGTVTLTGGEGDLVNRGVVAALRENAQGKTAGGEVLIAAKNVTTDPGSIVTAAGQEKGGDVKIDAKDTIYASGKIEATSSEGAGGQVVMTGERVGLVQAEVDVSGATQGGTVLAGGDLSGANPEVRNAKALVMTADSVIRADAAQTGDGGKVILWSDEYTGFYGEILARGGPQGGDGGFVETSAKWNLQAMGQVDVGATQGQGGSWLLDPYDIYITTTEANVSATPGAGPPPSMLFQAIDQNAQVSVDRILFALNNNQDVTIRVGPAVKTIFSGLGEIANGEGNITVTVPIVAALASTGSLSLINNWVMSGTSGYGDINIEQAITVGGNLTLQAGDDRGSPEVFALRTNGGRGGDVLVNAPLYVQRTLNMKAGDSVASNTGGTGGDVIINASIYAGQGLSIIAGNANQGWNTPNQLADPLSDNPLPYLPQRQNGNPNLSGADDVLPLRASGGTGGQVQIASGVSLYLGDGTGVQRNYQILAGTAGGNAEGGPLSISATILAFGSGVNLTLASGLGLDSGTLTLNSPLGTSGQVVDLSQIFPFEPLSLAPAVPPTLTSSILNTLTLKAGDRVTVAQSAQANTIRLQPLNPEGAIWVGQTDVDQLDVLKIGNVNGINSLENLIAATSLSLGTPDADNPQVTMGNVIVDGDYRITNLGTTTPANFTSIGATAATGGGFVVGTQYIITAIGTTDFTAVGASANTVGTVFIATGAGAGTGTVLQTDFTATGTGNAFAATTGTVRILTGDIGIGQAGPITLSAPSITFEGNASAISFSGSAGQPFSVSASTGATMTFNNGGPLFSNFGGSTVDVYIPGGTINLQNVEAPGNKPQAAPNSGTLFLDVANLTGTRILGNSSIQIARTTDSANTGAINLSGNVTVTAARLLNIFMPGNFDLVASGAITQTAGILTIPGTSSFSANGAITLAQANLFTGAVGLSTSGAGSATIRDANALTLGILSLSGGLAATSTGALNLGQGSVGGVLTATSNGGAITQAGALAIIGNSSFAAGNAPIDLVTNSGGNNDFIGAVSLSTTGNNAISIRDVNALTLGSVSTAAGTAAVTIVTGGNISQQSGTSITSLGTGNFTLQATAAGTSVDLASGANNIASANVVMTGGANFQDFALRNIAATADTPSATTPLSLRNLSLIFDNAAITLPAANFSTLTGSLVLTAGGNITQLGTLTVPGTSAITSTGGLIDLVTNSGNNNNFTGAVSLSTTGNNAISIRDVNALTLGSVSMGAGAGVLTVRSGADLIQTPGTTIVTGTAAVNINAGASSITLANQNDFRGAVTLTGGTTQITDINSLTLGTLSTGALTATSSGALNLGTGTVDGALAATSNGGGISQTDAGLDLRSTANFNAGGGAVTMTAGLAGGTANNVYQGNVTLTAGEADFLVAEVNGIGRFGQAVGSTVVAGTLTLRSPSAVAVDFNLANGLGGFELSSSQLARMSVGTLATRVSGAGNLVVGTFNPTGIAGLNLITAGTGNISVGSIRTGAVAIQTAANSSNGNLSSGAITAGSLSMDLLGTAAFSQPNQVQNLGNTVVRTGGLTFQNQTGLNLAGSASMPGRLSLEVAGQFYNLSGGNAPLASVQGGSVIKSLSLMGGLPNAVSGLAGFSYRYDGVMPTSGNVMSFAVPPLTMFAPNGTVIAGVNLSGTDTGGGQLNTFLTGSDSLNWIVADFSGFNFPEAPRAVLEYTLYPQRVEPETRSLPEATFGQLQRELGRPPTVEEVMAREVAQRDAERVRSGAILERSSFDLDESLPEERAQNSVPTEIPPEGQIPQANRDSDLHEGSRDQENSIQGTSASKAPQRANEVKDSKKPSRVYAMAD